MLFRPQSTLSVSISINMNQFSRTNFGRNALLWPQYTLSAAILLWPKVTVIAATKQSSCGRITVAAARRKGPFRRSLIKLNNITTLPSAPSKYFNIYILTHDWQFFAREFCSLSSYLQGFIDKHNSLWITNISADKLFSHCGFIVYTWTQWIKI